MCQKAQISSVTTQVDQKPCFFDTLIENLPALIEKSPKILNPKLKDKCLFLYLHGRKLANLEHELQRNIFSRGLNILTPVSDVSTVKLMKFSVTCT